MGFILYNGIGYPVEDIQRAKEEYLRRFPGQKEFTEKEYRQMLIEEFHLTGVMPRPYRENDKGYLLYPGFIARDILEKVGAL